jgi:hypothetical protein
MHVALSRPLAQRPDAFGTQSLPTDCGGRLPKYRPSPALCDGLKTGMDLSAGVYVCSSSPAGQRPGEARNEQVEGKEEVVVRMRAHGP